MPKPLSTRPLASHVECAQCGYEVTQLPTDGPCPECGFSIATTRTRLQVASHLPGRHDRAAYAATAVTAVLFIASSAAPSTSPLSAGGVGLILALIAVLVLLRLVGGRAALSNRAVRRCCGSITVILFLRIFLL